MCFLTYPPGTRLSEIALANEFGVSRTPVRSAISKLEALGFVQIRRGVGTIVSEIDRKRHIETLYFRRELALLSCNLSRKQDISTILEKLDALIEENLNISDTLTVTEFAKQNARLFEILQDLTANHALRNTAEDLYYLTARIWVNAIPQLSLREEMSEFVSEAQAIRRALAGNDIEAVGHIRWLHITNMIDRLSRQNESTAAGKKYEEGISF